MRRKSWLLFTAAAAISAILATGCVYAKSDADSLLHHFYGERSQRAIAQTRATAAAQNALAAAKLNERSEELANDARKAISMTARDRISEAAKQVQAAGNSYIEQMDDAKAELTADPDLREAFDSYVENVARTSSEELDQVAADTINQLTQSLTTDSNH